MRVAVAAAAAIATVFTLLPAHPGPVTVPAGTIVLLRFETPVDFRHTQAGRDHQPWPGAALRAPPRARAVSFFRTAQYRRVRSNTLINGVLSK